MHQQWEKELLPHLCQIGQGPNSPMLALGRLVAAHQAEDRLKAAVVDVPLALDVPPLNGGHHALPECEAA